MLFLKTKAVRIATDSRRFFVLVSLSLSSSRELRRLFFPLALHALFCTVPLRPPPSQKYPSDVVCQTEVGAREKQKYENGGKGAHCEEELHIRGILAIDLK